MRLLAHFPPSMVPMLRSIAHLFGINIPELLSAAERRQQILTSIAIGLPVTLGFVFFNFLEGFRHLAVTEAIGVALLPLAAWLQYRRETWISLAEWLVLLWGAMVTTALAIYGGIEGSGVLWIFSFPFLAFFLKGQVTGWLVSLGWVTIGAIARAYSADIPAAWPFTPTFNGHLVAAMLCAVCIAAVFNLVRVRFMLMLVSARERSEAAHQAKSRFLAATSHDLRQPLMAINLFLDALSHTPLNTEQQRFATHLGNSVESMNEMLNTLLSIARLDASAVQAQPQAIAGRALFAWLESEFASTFIARKLRFKLYFPVEDMTLLTDFELLKNILRNLLSNALKFCHQGGVLVSMRRRNGECLLQVWDTGIGIDAEHLAQIFDEYYQVGNKARDSTQGVGLGLAIVQRQARLLGTEVVCHSRPGKGSRFELSLPLTGR